MKRVAVVSCAWALLICTAAGGSAFGVRDRLTQEGGSRPRRGNVRSVTIPVTVNPRDSRVEGEYIPVDFRVMENGEEQTILSQRGSSNSPLSLAILIQDDVVSRISNEIKGLADFIRRQPRGTRVFVGYIRVGSLQVRQRFTTDLERAADALRVPVGSPSVAPFNPYVEIVEALKRFESQPTGRRAMIVVSDGLDTSRGVDSASPTQSLDLQRAINEAQRRGVAIYSLYAPTAATGEIGSSVLTSYAQGSLNRLSDETGGRAFFQGTGAPVSFDPYLKDLSQILPRQIAVTYLSTHAGGGFRRIAVTSPGGAELSFPTGYTR